MKKIAAAAAVAFGALAAGSPALLGMLAQDRITQLAEAASAGRVTWVEVIEYERGWLRSRARLGIGLQAGYVAVLERADSGDADRSALWAKLRTGSDSVYLEISHGPALPGGGIGVADVTVRMNATDVLGDPLAAAIEMGGPIEAALRVGIGSGSSFRWTVPPVAFSSPAATVSITRLSGEGMVDAARRRHAGRMGVDTMEFSADAAGARVENLAISMDLAGGAGGIRPGSSLISLDRLAIDLPRLESAVVMEDVEVSGLGELSADGTLLHNRYEMTLESLTNTIGGDEHVVTDIRLDSGFRNFSMDALIAYMDWALEIAGETDPTATLASLRPILHGALAAEPEIEIGPVGFNWNDGGLQASMLLRIDNEMLPAEPAFSLFDGALWSRLAIVEADVEVDRDIAEWIAMQTMVRQGGPPAGDSAGDSTEESAEILRALARGTLVALVAQGMLEETEGGYRFRGSFENGVVEVNGQVLPMGGAAPGLF